MSKPSSATSSVSNQMKKTAVKPLLVCSNGHPLVNRVCDELNWEICEKEEEWSIAWIDGRVIDTNWYKILRPMQRVNHFPGIEYLARKKSLGLHLNAIREYFPEDYDFFPKTFLLPEDATRLREYAAGHKNRTYICKPDASCQGKGIFLTRNIDSIELGSQVVVQRYLHNVIILILFLFNLAIFD